MIFGRAKFFLGFLQIHSAASRLAIRKRLLSVDFGGRADRLLVT